MLDLFDALTFDSMLDTYSSIEIGFRSTIALSTRQTSRVRTNPKHLDMYVVPNEIDKPLVIAKDG